MKYTKQGLCISLDELKELANQVENQATYHNMEPYIYIKGGDRPTIKQYCYYADCYPVNHTYGTGME